MPQNIVCHISLCAFNKVIDTYEIITFEILKPFVQRSTEFAKNSPGFDIDIRSYINCECVQCTYDDFIVMFVCFSINAR